MNKPILTLSVVSHGQSRLVGRLIADLNRLELKNVEIVFTLNIAEDESPFHEVRIPYQILRNGFAKGFGANHNAAFRLARGAFFAVVNPDIRISEFDLELLLSSMKAPAVGSVAPVVIDSNGVLQDNARRFPTISSLLRRLMSPRRSQEYEWHDMSIEVDWTAGMFVVFRREAFFAVNGFDEDRFFMYFEDVDICARLRSLGWSVLLEPKVVVIHDAQRATLSNRRHLVWHLSSAFRYFTGL